MRRFFKILTVCMLLGALLTGCKQSADSVQPALDFRTRLMDASDCRFSVKVTADYDARVYQFAMDCGFVPESAEATLRVTAPETIAGISATVDGQTAAVTFDDVSLELGTMAGGHVAPMQLPQLLGTAWTEGYIVSAGKLESGWLGTYQIGYDDEKLDILTYFSDQGVPYQAEIYAGERCILSAEMDNFSFS